MGATLGLGAAGGWDTSRFDSCHCFWVAPAVGVSQGWGSSLAGIYGCTAGHSGHSPRAVAIAPSVVTTLCSWETHGWGGLVLGGSGEGLTSTVGPGSRGALF